MIFDPNRKYSLHELSLMSDVESLKKRIADLKEGDCRRHCRVRKEVWLDGFRWGFVRAHKSLASVDDAGKEYEEWKRRNKL